MPSTSDPNELRPLSELANRTVQEHIRKIPEFATSSRWAASAVVVHLSEIPGRYETRVGFELKTPLDCPLQDIVSAPGDSKEQATRRAVEEWLAQFLKPALAIHSDKDPHARLGETVHAAQQRAYAWRMATGPLHVLGNDADECNALRADLHKNSLFDRLNLAAILPMHQDLPLFCLKLRIARDSGPPQVECLINDAPWPAGAEVLQRFHLPRSNSRLEIRQYCFLRRTGKSPVKSAEPAAKPAGKPVSTAAPAPPPPKKPWWKVW